MEDLEDQLDSHGTGQDARAAELGGGDVAQPPAGHEGDAERQRQSHKQERHRPIMTLSLPEREDPPWSRSATRSMGRVARITIDRPERHNAMSFQVMQELGEAFELAKTDDSVRVAC